MGQENGISETKAEISEDGPKFEETLFLRYTFIPRIIFSAIWAAGILYATYHVYICAEGENLCKMRITNASKECDDVVCRSICR